MRRRTFITATGACGLSAVAGCLSTGTAPGTEAASHPFANATLSIRIDEESETPHDVEATEIRDVAIALGLVRGFDRDDAVLEETDAEELADES